MSELPGGIPPASPPRPRPSSSCVVIRRGDDGRWRVLLGLRSKTSRFMPSHLAFLGGGLEDVDGPEGYAACATRELEEESKLRIEERDWLDVGERTTPPMFPVRFYTRFFVAEAPTSWDPPDPPPSPREVERLSFADPAEVVEDWSTGKAKLPPPVLALIRTLVAHDRAPLDQLAQQLKAANQQEELAPRIEFTPGIWMLPVDTETLPPATHTNVWIPGGDRFVVVDPGSTQPDEQARLLRVIDRRRAEGQQPYAVLLTHGHRDHLGGAVGLAAQLNVPLMAHRDLVKQLAPLNAQVCCEALADGDSLDLSGLTLQVVESPGHAGEHLAFRLAESDIVIIGDLASGISTILIDPETGHMGDYLDSLAKVLRLRPKLLLPGHGPPLPSRALKHLIGHRRNRESRVLQQLSEDSCSLAQVAKGAYPEPTPAPEWLMEMQTLAHLLELQRHGQAEGSTDGRSWKLGANPETTPQRIERILRETFDPVHFELRDDSAHHVGHAGATSGGGHYSVVLVSAAFEGCSLLEQHRMVNESLKDLIGGAVHALALKTSSPTAWKQKGPA